MQSPGAAGFPASWGVLCMCVGLTVLLYGALMLVVGPEGWYDVKGYDVVWVDGRALPPLSPRAAPVREMNKNE